MANYEGLRFAYSDIKNELRWLRELAKPFMDDGQSWVFDQCLADLDSAQNSRGSTRWSISKETPLRTKVSEGKFRASDKTGGERVYGELCFVWDLINPDKGKRTQSHFILNGETTTTLIIKQEDGEVIARWQFEVGDQTSPGYHFHSAVNQYEKEGMFPEWLKVPRFPGLLLTPQDGLEFLIGELFQLDWAQQVSSQSHERDAWANSQQTRLTKLFSWKLSQIRESETTPWMSLKSAKPSLTLFSE